MVKIKQIWVVVFVFTANRLQTRAVTWNLENLSMVKIKQFWVVIFVFAANRLQTRAVTWKINRWLK